MKKRIFCLVLALLLLMNVPALAAAGEADDPLVTQSYAEQSGQSTLSSVLSTLRSTLSTMVQRISSVLGGQSTTAVESSTPQTYTVHTGASAVLSQGGCITLLSGSGSMQLDSGVVINVTVGSPASTGSLTRYNRYMGCENASASISLTDGSIIAVEGDVDVSVGCPFTDVPLGAWFFQDVLSAYNRGLVNGMSATLYEPNGSLTVAQAIKLAACMHQLYQDGSVSLQNGTDAWYSTYLDYALSQDILSEEYAVLSSAELNMPITRAEFVHIFYHALPRSEYGQMNAVMTGAIPDVTEDALYSQEIYTFYRAGILTGDAADEAEGVAAGRFRPGDSIKRSEVATIMNRMFDSTARKHFTLV